MASAGDQAALINEYNGVIVASHCMNAAAVLYLYNWLITIDQEVEYFWKGKVTGAAILFYLNRYISLASFVISLVDWMPMTDKVRNRPSSFVADCIAYSIYSFAVELVPYVPWAAFAGLRCFALTHGNWVLATLVFMLSLVPLGVNLVYFFYGITGENIPLLGCSSVDLTPVGLSDRFALVSRPSLILADCILILATWLTLARRATFRPSYRETTFTSVMLWDGALYFVVLLALNALHLSLTLTSIDVTDLQDTSLVGFFTDPLTSILVQHFLLRLQWANNTSNGSETGAQGDETTSSIVFDRVIGSIGGSLQPGNHDYADHCTDELSIEDSVMDSVVS
ncbi:hypothetical protein BD311DRAFT_868333 [Dichomitus squalens]|uniref:DUF6533 domain-containing protein n=1 Tax=Dichomitus squalens TaxID=114155 RepID=A0A4Q9MAD4_9APHY|nr:hypothetical protein BD311DRAFT_868333 [Dichomitus squalens]